MRIEKIVINLGFKCNFRCAHCANVSQKRKKLAPLEIKTLVSAINRYRIRRVHFIGGEPSLYLRDIKSIIGGVNDPGELSVTITTNGSFASNEAAACALLSEIPALARVQLSYDKFHAKFLPAVNVRALHSACRTLGVKFGVLCAIQSPADMLILAPFRDLRPFPVFLQKVLPQGEAIKSKAAYSFYKAFDRKTLKRACPDRRNLIYFCGKGFTICCSALVINLNLKGICHKTAEGLFKSKFYKIMQEFNFGELLEKAGVGASGLAAELSSVCNLCEYVFADGKMAGKI